MIKFFLRLMHLEIFLKVNLKYYIKNFFKTKFNQKYDLAIIDSKFPLEKPLGFRNTEINFLLDNIKHSTAYTMFPTAPGEKAFFTNIYGKIYFEFKRSFKKYFKYYPKHKNRKIEYLPFSLRNKLVYCYFLAETYILLPYLNKNKLPFIFVLFPGGFFGIDNESSEAMLREIFASPYFQKVIVSESIAKRYLLEKNLCKQENIIELYGAHPPFTKEEVAKRQKIYYPKDKKTIDICFCAFKHSPKGFDKGYDLYIEAAKRLAPKYPNLRFHVIGSFNENDIDITSIKDKIFFYGVLCAKEIKEVYLGIDIFLAPNRPSALYKGSFDGFPQNGTSIFWGCTILNTDEYKTNTHFTDGEDVVIIKPELNDICEKLEYLINNMDKCYEIGRKGQKKFFELVEPKKRGEAILNIINTTLNEINKKTKIK